MTELFLRILGISASVSVVAVFLLLISSFVNKRYAAKWMYLIWIFLSVRLLVPFGGAGGPSAAEVLQEWKAHMTVQEETDVNTAPERQIPARIMLEVPRQMTTPFAAESEKSMTLLDIVAGIWMIGSIVFISVHLFSYLYYKRQVMKNGRPVKDAVILQQYLRIKRILRMKSTVPVMEFSGAVSPMILGFFRPVLILPREQYSQEELYFILKHELVHLKRGDVYWKLLFTVANGLHWFNPVIWLMQKEAAVDMELSCDEKVTKGADFETKKAYTETLLSTLHKGCGKGISLSTGFYGGKQVMKKRFQNILRKTGKKNGCFFLACTVVLTLFAGTMVGCSAGKENEEAPAQGNSEEALPEVLQDTPEQDTEFAQAEEAADTITLTFMKEGQPEEKQASLVEESEYVLYLPDGEWQKEEADMWRAAANGDVRIWVSSFESDYPIEELLAGDGFMPDEEGMSRQEDGISYHARLYEAEGKVWCVEYSYPVEAEEGWGRELPVIAATFAVIVPEDSLVLGYITEFTDITVTIDRQDWVVPDSPDWKPEYDADAGFEIVDLEGADVTYPLAGGCQYFILENHTGESLEIGQEEFGRYLEETDFPMFWSVGLENGEVVSLAEWYRP